MFGPKFQVKGNTPGTGRSQNKNAPQLRLSCASVYFMGTPLSSALVAQVFISWVRAILWALSC